MRYSEDIDLVQVEPGPAGLLVCGLRNALDPWFGEARWKQSQGRITFRYRFLSEDVRAMRLRPKVEINTREHAAVLDFMRSPFSAESRWYSAPAEIATFELDELLATRMRALFQRRNGRDVFDPETGLADGQSDAGRILAAFGEYMDRDGSPVTRAMFERSLAEKISDIQFNAYTSALLRPGFACRPADAARAVSEQLHLASSGRAVEGGGGWSNGHRPA